MASTSNSSSLRIQFKTADGDIVDAPRQIERFSALVADILRLSIEIVEPIQLAKVSTTAIVEISKLLRLLNDDENDRWLGELPSVEASEAAWNTFTVSENRYAYCSAHVFIFLDQHAI